jgi:hypothetical protein
MHSTKGRCGGRGLVLLVAAAAAEPAMTKATGAYGSNDIDLRHRVGIPSHQGSLQ